MATKPLNVMIRTFLEAAGGSARRADVLAHVCGVYTQSSADTYARDHLFKGEKRGYWYLNDQGTAKQTRKMGKRFTAEQKTQLGEALANHMFCEVPPPSMGMLRQVAGRLGINTPSTTAVIEREYEAAYMRLIEQALTEPPVKTEEVYIADVRRLTTHDLLAELHRRPLAELQSVYTEQPVAPTPSSPFLPTSRTPLKKFTVLLLALTPAQEQPFLQRAKIANALKGNRIEYRFVSLGNGALHLPRTVDCCLIYANSATAFFRGVAQKYGTAVVRDCHGMQAMEDEFLNAYLSWQKVNG